MLQLQQDPQPKRKMNIVEFIFTSVSNNNWFHNKIDPVP